MTKFTKLNIGDTVASSGGRAWKKLSVESNVSYLTFSSPSTFTLNVKGNAKYWDGTLQYSTDTSNWNEWDGTSAISSSADGKLYIRGTGNTYITGPNATTSKGGWVLNGSDISCSGNIENLLDYQTVANGEHPTMADYCYRFLFKDCSSLTTAPELPATTLTLRCYYFMFYNCISLTTAPELPATTLTDYCYYNMFFRCASLTTAPELPATTLSEYCYYYMFRGCTSLTTLPELPATTLAVRCYYGMFTDCTSIKLSETQTGEYQTAYRIPTSGTGTTANYALDSMFGNTGGTFKDTPLINTTYYLHSSNSVV